MAPLVPAALEPWTTNAINLPEHADNPIHTDAGARAAGFPAAMITGTTIYAYLCHVPTKAWGRAWLEGGGASVQFRSPIFDGDDVECVPVAGGEDGSIVEARVNGEMRARLTAFPTSIAPHGPAVGERLPDMELLLDDRLGGYGIRAGDDLPLYSDQGVAHPAAWPVLANWITARNLVDGAWIHVKSRIDHLGTAPMGATVIAESTVVDRFDSRAGERAVVEIRIAIDGALIATVLHESIVALPEN